MKYGLTHHQVKIPKQVLLIPLVQVEKEEVASENSRTQDQYHLLPHQSDTENGGEVGM